MPKLEAARYGKDNIRVYKRHIDEKTGVQSVVEMVVTILLEGEIEVSYTEADNSVVVATDTMKNTAYIMAKEHPVTPPELYAAITANHFIETYKHIHTAHVKVVTLRWARLTVDGEPHPHSFYRDGAETRIAEASAIEGKGTEIRSGIDHLLVLKSTGSQFHSFVRNEYATLKDTWDRILSTEVAAGWTWNTFAAVKDVEAVVSDFDKAFDGAREITLSTFAKENSPSVQNTMYKMCEQILAAHPTVSAVDYSLPNKHYFEIDLSWHKGLKNTGKDATVYAPQSDPNGLIKCTVAR